MFRKFITGRVMIPVLLCLQVLPLVAFPLNVFSLSTQEWWLPAFLTLLTIISLVQILLRRDLASWPWYLLSFAQGLNIISRMMMLFPHATVSVDTAAGETQVANTGYLVIAFVTMLVSAFEIWYCELPEVRQRLAARSQARASA
jgi:hypothetical protein